MTKNWIAKLVVVTLIMSSLTACAGKGAGSAAGTADQAVQQAENAAAVDYSSGTPWPYIDLEGVVTPDTPTDPKDNFALYANKDKILNLKIPEGRPFGGAFMNLVQQQSEDVKNMFLGEAPKEHDAKLAFDLFWLMMDWDSRNALGVAPLKVEVDKVEKMTEDTYFVRGCTALLDAVGGALHHIGNIHKCARDEDRSEKTLFIMCAAVRSL